MGSWLHQSLNENKSLVPDQKYPLLESSLLASPLTDDICAEPTLGALSEFALMTCISVLPGQGRAGTWAELRSLAETAAARSNTASVSQRTCRGGKEETGR